MPAGWARCDGQELRIAEFMDLFSVLGSRYGGDGQDIFALPDLRGRVPMHSGRGPGLPRHLLGEASPPTSAVIASGSADGTGPPPHLCLSYLIALTGDFPTPG